MADSEISSMWLHSSLFVSESEERPQIKASSTSGSGTFNPLFNLQAKQLYENKENWRNTEEVANSYQTSKKVGISSSLNLAETLNKKKKADTKIKAESI